MVADAQCRVFVIDWFGINASDKAAPCFVVKNVLYAMDHWSHGRETYYALIRHLSYVDARVGPDE